MKDNKPVILLFLILGIIIFVNSSSDEVTSVNPSDVFCQTILKCYNGEILFEPGDLVSSPTYSLGLKVGRIITMNKENLTATIKWNSGETSTLLIKDLNKVKEL